MLITARLVGTGTSACAMVSADVLFPVVGMPFAMTPGYGFERYRDGDPT